MFVNDATARELEALLSEDSDPKSDILFLNSQSGEGVPYSVMRLIAPSRIITANAEAHRRGVCCSLVSVH